MGHIMRLSHIAWAVAAACSLAACQPKPEKATEAEAAASPVETASDAKAFLTSLYAHYNGSDPDGQFTPLNENAPQWFDPEMVALLDEDARLAQGDIGAIDADPVCGCQDYSHLTAAITIASATANAAKAQVTVTETDPNFDTEGRKPRPFTYDLVRVNGEWRIHDIGNPDMPSLRDWIARSNAEASKG